MRDYVARAGRLAGRAGPPRRRPAASSTPPCRPTPSRTSASPWPSAPRWSTPDLHDVDDEEWAAFLARLVRRTIATSPTTAADGNRHMRVQIDSERCQGHGRCYDLAPELFGEDEDGYAVLVLDGGRVPPEPGGRRPLAVANCPEQAIDVLEEA